MTENTRQVLEMLAEGKITTEEADRLIAALREQPGTPSAKPARPRYVRVIVDAENSKEDPVKVNIRVPLMLLRAGVRLASVIPPAAQDKVNKALREQGVDFDIATIKPENLDELIDELRDLTVDIEHKRDDVKVKVFVE